MSDFKIEKGNFTTVQNNIFRYQKEGKKLSPEAWGVYVFMLSLPEDWDFTIRGLEKVVNAGKNKIQRILKELVDAGFITRTQTQNNGLFGKMEYTILQTPSNVFLNDSPCPQKPCPQKPYPQNPPQLSTKELKTNKTKDKRESISENVEMETIKSKDSLSLDYINKIVISKELNNVKSQVVFNYLKINNFKNKAGRLINQSNIIPFLENWDLREINNNKSNSKTPDYTPDWVHDYMKELEEFENQNN